MDIKRSKILSMTPVETRKFIKLYEKEKCLWQSDHVNYHHKLMRQEAAERIANEMALPGFTAEHVLLKFKNVRTTYSKELKLIAESIREGNTGDQVYKPKFCWFADLNFLRPHVSTIWNKVLKETRNMQPSSPDDDLYFHPSSDASQDALKEDDSEYFEQVEEPTSSRKIRTSSVSEKSKSHASQPDNDFEDLSQTLTKITENLRKFTKETVDRNGYDHFGKYIACTLRNMPKKEAMYAQKQMMEAIAWANTEPE